MSIPLSLAGLIFFLTALTSAKISENPCFRPVADIQQKRLSPLIPTDNTAAPDGYLYPASIFPPIELPESAQRALASASG